MTFDTVVKVSSMTAEALELWIIQRIARLLSVEQYEISVSEPLSNFGLESIEAFTLSGELSDLLGLKLPSTLAWDFSTIADLAHYLESEKKAQRMGNL